MGKDAHPVIWRMNNVRVGMVVVDDLGKHFRVNKIYHHDDDGNIIEVLLGRIITLFGQKFAGI